MRKHIRNPLFLFYVLVIYVVTQFSWWLYLIASLYSKIYTDPVLLEKKTLMLVGEGSVFVIILFGGVFMIKRAYKKEHDLNKLQENFLLSISHELKTPIASVTLFLQTLQKRDLDETKREEIYAQSLNEINRLESLVSNLLITRSIDSNNYFLNREPIPLHELVQTSCNMLKNSLLKNHVLLCDLQPVTVNADKEALVSIVTNLLQNAAKYSPVGSEISIHLADKNDRVMLTVSDNGIGIPDSKKLATFKRFYREENEMTRKSKGTGLGLFITKFLVEQHGGTIALSDNTPNGLSVSILLNK